MLYHLYLLRHFFYPLFDLDYWNYFLNYTVNYLVLHFNVIFNLPCTTVFNNRHYFLYYLLYLYYLRYLNNSLYYFFNKDRHFNDLLNDLFDWNYLLNNDFNLLILNLYMVDNSFNLHFFLHLDNFLFDDLHFHNFGHLSLNLYELLNDGWHLNNSLYFALIRDKLLHFSLDNKRCFYGHMYNLLYFPDLLHLHYLLDQFLYCYDFRNFNYSINYFLNNLLHLHYFRANPEYFENIIHVDGIHNLSFYHTNHTLVHLKYYACF